MKLKNILIVVKDIEKSKQFYQELFRLYTVLDNGGNMILTEELEEINQDLEMSCLTTHSWKAIERRL